MRPAAASGCTACPPMRPPASRGRQRDPVLRNLVPSPVTREGGHVADIAAPVNAAIRADFLQAFAPAGARVRFADAGRRVSVANEGLRRGTGASGSSSRAAGALECGDGSPLCFAASRRGGWTKAASRGRTPKPLRGAGPASAAAGAKRAGAGARAAMPGVSCRSAAPGTPGSSLADQGDENLADQDRATLERGVPGGRTSTPFASAGALTLQEGGDAIWSAAAEGEARRRRFWLARG